MTPTDPPEYRRLALDSSNDVMRYDALLALGQPDDARRHILRAADGRDGMGHIKAAAGGFAHAAEDWLAAAECYFLGGEPTAMAAAVARVRELADADRIPADRTDLRDTLAEREAEFRALTAATPAGPPAARTEAPVPAPQP